MPENELILKATSNETAGLDAPEGCNFFISKFKKCEKTMFLHKPFSKEINGVRKWFGYAWICEDLHYGGRIPIGY